MAFSQNHCLSYPLSQYRSASGLSTFIFHSFPVFSLLLSSSNSPLYSWIKQGTLGSWICLPQTNLLNVGGIISKPWGGSDDLWPERMGSPTILHVMFMACTGSPTRGMVQEKTGIPNVRGGSSEDIKQKGYY